MADDFGFCLYDLRLKTVLYGRAPDCRQVEGDSFRAVGEDLIFDNMQQISMHGTAVLFPLLTGKQRLTDADHLPLWPGRQPCPASGHDTTPVLNLGRECGPWRVENCLFHTLIMRAAL